MARTEHTEMASIERREFRLTEALDDGKHCRVDEADVGVRVLIAQVPDALIVAWFQFHNVENTAVYVIEQVDKDARPKASVYPVVDFHQNRRREHQLFRGRYKKVSAFDMAAVRAVEYGEQRARIEDQRHERGTGRCSPDSSPVSVYPEAAIPIMLGRGRGFGAATFASRASRITVASDTSRRRARSRSLSSRSLGAIIVVRRMHNYARLAS